VLQGGMSSIAEATPTAKAFARSCREVSQYELALPTALEHGHTHRQFGIGPGSCAGSFAPPRAVTGRDFVTVRL
jgi:hypothetical protein